MPITNPAPPAMTKTKPSSTSVKKASNLTSERYEALNGIGQIAQAGLIAARQYADAGALGIHWENVSGELAKLAEKQESIAKLIDPLLTAGPYAALIAAVLPLGLQIAVNHGVGKAGMMNTVSPGLLDAQIRTRITQMEMEAVKAQKKAEEEMKALRESMDDNTGN
jgi:hypothetical protein